MVLWLTILISVSFSLHFIKYVRMETFNKNSSTFKHRYRVFFLCQVALMLGGLNSLTHSHLFPGVFTKVPSHPVEQGFSPICRVTMAQGSLHGDSQEFHNICIQHGIVAPKINAWAGALVSPPVL